MIILAHDRDLDGIGSHAILHRYCVNNDIPIRHFFVNYDDFCSKLGQIVDIRGEKIVIVDLGYSNLISGCMPSLEEIGSENEIKWFDHHDWSGIKRPENTQINIDITKCGAELVAEEYLPEDEIASKIAQLARAQDFMEENELAWKLYDVISAGFNKSKLVKFLSRGIFWNVELETCYRDYQYKRKKGFDYLDKHSKLYRIGDWTCLLGFSKPYLSSTIAAGHLLEKNPDFVVCVWPNGKLSFRRNNPEVGLREMAALFNGGGRDSAAGGNYGATVTEKEYMRVFDKIVERINLAYAGLKASQ